MCLSSSYVSLGMGPWRSQVTKEGPGSPCLSPLAQTLGIKMLASRWLWFELCTPHMWKY